ncbi:hypothetical protein [Bartonella koehlerae]|uniref:Uncharacterized protein n=1 Tax=Bartonella koehlerae C-29 TaxID=1134510 RepID=A0A067WFD4_9HYPH|nr:hypothetical protein [Bartonella koehlerae]KEC55488.1 hypothetical protein O9A_00768 [Bartonella koehlerae C-29]
MATKVFVAGVQNVFAGDKANTVLRRSSSNDGRMETLTINSGANSLVYFGAILEGKAKVNGSGKLHFDAGDNDHQTMV